MEKEEKYISENHSSSRLLAGSLEERISFLLTSLAIEYDFMTFYDSRNFLYVSQMGCVECVWRVRERAVNKNK